MENVIENETIEVKVTQTDDTDLTARRKLHKKRSMATFAFYLIVYVFTILSACLTTYVAQQAGLLDNNNQAYQCMALSATAAALCWLHVITLSALMSRAVNMVKTTSDFRFWIDLGVIKFELFGTIFLALIAFALQVASNCIYAEMTGGLQIVYDCSISASVFTGLICLTILISIINSYRIRKPMNNDNQSAQGNI